MKNESSIKRALTPQVITMLILGSLIFMISVIYIENKNNSKNQIKSLEMIAKAYSVSIQSFRDFYAQIILDNIHDNAIDITHDYYNKTNAMPIPATMTLDLIDFLNNKNANANLKLLSDYPYPWREDRETNIFDKKALIHFKTTSSDSYYKLYKKNDNRVFEYATPIRMTASCVKCHNTHPDSPKKDWKIGDIRGIQVITLKPELVGETNIEERIYFATAIFLFFVFNMTVILWLIQKNNFAFKLILKDQKKLADALQQAESANRSKNTFLANISHEIRTPLNAIIGFANLLKEAKLPENEHKQSSIIAQSGKSLLAIINEILDYSKIESGKFEIVPEPSSLKELLNHLYSLFEAKSTEKGVNFDYKEDVNIPEKLLFDNIKIQQVLSNLISNAIKFSNEGGNVWLKAKLISKTKNDAVIYFEVKDDGIGIQKDKQKLIFEPFSQADGSVSKRYGGTGLGLTIISKILELMGSTIKIKSEENKGSKFYFEIKFPIVNNTESEVRKKEEIPINKKNKLLIGNILVAEDNEVNQMLVKAMLEKLKLSPDFANDGNEAVTLFKQNRYNLVFMDINMPNCDGISATKQIREYEETNNLKNTPIIALTANVIKGDSEKYLDIGMTEHLGKPIIFDKLKETLEKYLEAKEINHQKYDMNESSKESGLSPNIIGMLLKKFYKNLPNDLRKLEDAINKKNSDEIYAAAHYIKGPCTNLRLIEPTKILENFEKKAKNKELEEYDIDILKNSLEKLKKELIEQGILT